MPTMHISNLIVETEQRGCFSFGEAIYDRRPNVVADRR
jgi:hypothetical protein